jgi:hypothetical protein
MPAKFGQLFGRIFFEIVFFCKLKSINAPVAVFYFTDHSSLIKQFKFAMFIHEERWKHPNRKSSQSGNSKRVEECIKELLKVSHKRSASGCIKSNTVATQRLRRDGITDWVKRSASEAFETSMHSTSRTSANRA